MIAPACHHPRTKKHGRDPYGHPRIRCCDCGKTWIVKEPCAIGDMRIDPAKAELALNMMLEGSSIRAIERIVGINRNTLLALLVLTGTRAVGFWLSAMKRLPAKCVEVDELWGFVACHERIRQAKNLPCDVGDCWCFMGIERDSKLILAWHLGKRDPFDAQEFTNKLAQAVSGRIQLTTDGLKYYPNVVFESFRSNIDFAQLIKIYGRPRGNEDELRYSPAEISGTCKRVRIGDPDKDLICTSFIERGNLTVRMGVRRLTRLTNAHSKKWQNHEAMIALFLLWYNFCRPHMTLKTTPAVAAGIADHTWSLRELLEVLAAHDADPATRF